MGSVKRLLIATGMTGKGARHVSVLRTRFAGARVFL
jgi:hypothetical protein